MAAVVAALTSTMGATYCARCLLPVTFAPGRAYAMCPACDAALRFAPEPRHPGTALADDDVAGYPMAARAADRRAGLTAALAALEGEWRAERWERFTGLISDPGFPVYRRGRFGCLIADFGCMVPLVAGSALFAWIGVIGIAVDGDGWDAVPFTLIFLGLTVMFARIAQQTIAAQLDAITRFRSQRAAYRARRNALRRALGAEPMPPRARDDDHPRLV